MRTTTSILAAALALLAAGCATGGAARADLRTPITIQHGRVESVEQVALETQAGKSAAIGGIWGALVSPRHRLAGAAVGAVVGGATTAIAEGSHTAYGYTVRLESGQVIKVMVEHGEIAAGTCVAVESGRTTNVRAVAEDRCQASGAAAADVRAAAEGAAAACHAAKEAALAAATAEEFDLLEKKARLACGH